MKIVTLDQAGRACPGVVVGAEVLNLSTAAPLLPAARLVPPSVKGILEAGDDALELVRRLAGQAADGAESRRAALRAQNALVPFAGARLLAPVPDPGLILGGAGSYRSHQKEMNSPTPERPASLYKSPAAVIGPGAPIVPPLGWDDMLDFEGEFSIVIGRPCHRVTARDALQYVAGYTLVNDVSARNWVAPVFSSTGVWGPIWTWEQNILGKQFPTFCPLGPVLTTRDEIPDPNSVDITTKLNGKTMQSANTSDLIFPVERVIEYYSQFYLFRPGDIVTTGSPPGVGFGRNPKVFMVAGDVVEVHVDRIGTLSNPVAPAAPT